MADSLNKVKNLRLLINTGITLLSQHILAFHWVIYILLQLFNKPPTCYRTDLDNIHPTLLGIFHLSFIYSWSTHTQSVNFIYRSTVISFCYIILDIQLSTISSASACTTQKVHALSTTKLFLQPYRVSHRQHSLCVSSLVTTTRLWFTQSLNVII